jgi:hypothetical protein
MFKKIINFMSSWHNHPLNGWWLKCKEEWMCIVLMLSNVCIDSINNSTFENISNL